MDPNKKMPNPKNSSPWILCPSKRFPGQMYYFNGSTGETAWCLSETDKNAKKGTIHKVTDRTHNYPEPFEPPVDDGTHTTNSSASLNNMGNPAFSHARERPGFGQVMFPRYVSPDIYSSNCVWALAPIVMPSQRLMLDQMTPTDQQVQLPLHPNYFQQSVVPSSPSVPFQNQPLANGTQTSEGTAKRKLSKEAQTSTTQCMKDEACQTLPAKRQRTKPESDSRPKLFLKTCRSVEILPTLTKNVGISTLSSADKVDNGTSKLSGLDKNDLRFKLIAKRRKIESTVVSKTVEKSEQSTSKTAEASTPKKHVTFIIQELDSSLASCDGVQEANQSPDTQMEDPSQLTHSPRYVVADTAVLLADWQWLEEFVKTDANCRLMIPHTVYTELEARSRGETGALSARQLLRKLAAKDSYMSVQSKPEYELPSEDSILKCCWDLLKDGSHVVLISNNENILDNAKSINLECYTLDEIKIDNETQNVCNKLKITAENNENKSVNLTMQDLNEINGVCSSKHSGFRVFGSRVNTLNTEPATDTERGINSDKLINLTRPRNKVNKLFSSEITNMKNQVSKLCISETNNINISPKQIIRKDLDKKTDQDNLVDNNRFDLNKRNVRKQNVTETSIEKSRETIKVSGITKLKDNFNLDVDLEKFHVKNAVMENRIKSRLEEWMCRLNQTMEGVLTEILLKEKNKIKTIMPPWNLSEAIQVTGQSFKKQPHIKTITDYFSMKLLNCNSGIGKLNKDIKPNDFMNLVGLSMILIEHLKEIKNCKELYEANDMLVDLIKNIEDPKTDIDLSLEDFNTQLFSRSEISDVKEPTGFKKSSADIVEYLEKHYAARQSSEIVKQIEAAKEKTIKEPATIDDNILNKESKVVRTSGKELNKIKINNTKAITVENTTATPHFENQPKVIRNVKITQGAEPVPAASSGDNEVNNLSDGNEKITNTPNHILDDLSVSATSAECAKALPVVKRFLVNLKGSLLKLVEFAKASIQEFKDGISMDRKADILKTTKQAQQYLRNITEGLKSIIARESSERKILKRLLVKAGDYVENHPVMSNYTQTVATFLKETLIIEKALERVLSLSNAASVKEKKEPQESLSTSPILPTRRLSKQRFQ